MLAIDRMEIDDAGGNPVKLARAVVKQLPDTGAAVPVREIAEAVDIYEIREEPLEGIEGGLVTADDKSIGSILVNSKSDERRRRYTIGHELGHYLNPWHRPHTDEGFRCASRDMVVDKFDPGDRALQMEVEANQFAAELLMPSEWVAKFLRRQMGVDIEHVLKLSDRFEVSRESAGRRYVSMTDEPTAIVFSKDGRVRYARRHQYFPALSVWSGDHLPGGSLSIRSSLERGKISDWADFDGDVWLRQPTGRRVCEQTMAQRDGYRMTLLALEDTDADEEDVGSEWAPPRFRK